MPVSILSSLSVLTFLFFFFYRHTSSRSEASYYSHFAGEEAEAKMGTSLMGKISGTWMPGSDACGNLTSWDFACFPVVVSAAPSALGFCPLSHLWRGLSSFKGSMYVHFVSLFRNYHYYVFDAEWRSLGTNLKCCFAWKSFPLYYSAVYP